MRKGKSVIGQPVYSLSDGTKVDSVKDLILEEGEDGVVALLVSEGGLLGTSTVVPFSAVARFGPSAVMIDDRASAVPAASDPRVHEILERRGTLLGSRVITDGGEELGTIADLYFDETSGRISGYEVSGGFLGDATRGSSYLPFTDIRTIGTDVVIATDEAREILDRPVADQAHGQVAAEDGSEEPADATAGDPDASLVGARSQGDLTDRSGAVVVARGQSITPEMVERARAEDELDSLYRVAGVTRPGSTPDPTGEALSKAAETASDLWARFTSKVSEMTDAAGQRMDTQQTKARLDAINDAIGRPVTKVFLDRDDSVILDLGDLVTHQAIQRADDAGLLDSLLASVYKAPDVTFTRDEMRAEIAGDSTVDKASGGASVVADLEAKVEDAEAAHGPSNGAGDQGREPAEPETHNGRQRRAGREAAAVPGQTIGQKPDAGTE